MQSTLDDITIDKKIVTYNDNNINKFIEDISNNVISFYD